MVVSVASALMSSRLSYANSVLVGCPKNILPVYSERSMDLLELSRSSPLVFLRLHPPIFWYSFIGCLSNGESGSSLPAYKAIYTGNAPYLADLLVHHKSIRFTRSSSSHLLDVPSHNLSFGSRAFRVSAIQVYNSVFLHICQTQTLTSFRRHLKTYYFQSAYFTP